MNKFASPPKYKVGDLVSMMMPGEYCGSMLGVVVEVRSSTITRKPLYSIHLPTGNQGVAYESHLESISERK
jgi:hypothetical protein